MHRIAAALLLALLAQAGMAQQRAPVFADPTKPSSPAPRTTGAQPRFADPSPERLTADQQRCRNLDTEIVRAEQQARDATTTGAQNQFAARRQQLMEQRGKAGCPSF